MAKAAPGKKLADGGGLYLLVPPAGNPSWRIKYRISGKEKTFSVGTYPGISLAAARVARSEVKALLIENKDPVTERRVNRAESAAGADNTFQGVAQEWLTMKKRSGALSISPSRPAPSPGHLSSHGQSADLEHHTGHRRQSDRRHTQTRCT
ncbi:MAG: DUF4102 domain-containing protein [Betaproteobacteria bacterium]|nr:DUF4102 domain-containing protein [Betaproteobacteria bacterium]